MRGKGMGAAALVVAVMGAFVPGCGFWGDDPEEPRICAAAKGGEDVCTSPHGDFSAIWTEASSKGEPPVQMWAEWPKSLPIRDVATSPEQLNAWFGNVETALHYVRTEQDAESYQASLDGRLKESLRALRFKQSEMLAEGRTDVLGTFHTALSESTGGLKDPLLAGIVLEKQFLQNTQKALEQAESDLAPYATRYAELVKAFLAYRDTEAAEKEKYNTLATKASQATLEQLDPIEQDLLLAAKGASKGPVELSMKTFSLIADLSHFAVETQPKLDAQSALIQAPDMTGGALRSLIAMRAYIQQRVTQSDARAKGLVMGVQMRRQALKLLDASPMVRAEATQARFHDASELFVAQAGERKTQAETGMPMGVKLGLPYLAKRYDALIAMKLLKPLCDPTSASWRESGCVSLRDHFDEVNTALQTTLPTQIKTGLSVIKANGGDAALLDLAQQKLGAGDLKGAAVLHDAALREVEGQ